MSPTQCTNQLINRLDPASRKVLLKHCDEMLLPSGTLLGQPGDVLEYAYFPSGCVITMMLQQNDDKGLEVGLIGDEGMLGIGALLGARESPYMLTVQSEGMVLRIDAEQLLSIIARYPVLEQQLQLYAGVLLQQLAQSSVCNRFHLVQARVARIILMFRDRLHSNNMLLTHEILANMLGARRVGVTKAAGILQKKLVLRYARGQLEVLNGRALETAACNCYALDKATYLTVFKN
jgi:CRP-like cAMP-binding protein